MLKKTIQKNKKALFNYQILERLEVGIILKGTEIKSVRKGNVNLEGAYVEITPNFEVEIINFRISQYLYQKNQFMNHDPTRKKKLLLHKKQIIKLHKQIQTKGLTIVPLKLYLKNNHAKLEIGLSRGKKLYDKRETIKQKEADRKISTIKI